MINKKTMAKVDVDGKCHFQSPSRPIPGGSPKLEEMSCELPLRRLGATAQGCVEAVDLWLDLTR